MVLSDSATIDRSLHFALIGRNVAFLAYGSARSAVKLGFWSLYIMFNIYLFLVEVSPYYTRSEEYEDSYFKRLIFVKLYVIMGFKLFMKFLCLATETLQI